MGAIPRVHRHQQQQQQHHHLMTLQNPMYESSCSTPLLSIPCSTSHLTNNQVITESVQEKVKSLARKIGIKAFSEPYGGGLEVQKSTQLKTVDQVKKRLVISNPSMDQQETTEKLSLEHRSIYQIFQGGGGVGAQNTYTNFPKKCQNTYTNFAFSKKFSTRTPPPL